MSNALDAILAQTWSHLLSGANPGRERSAYTLMQFATVGLDGAPKLRTVVMRRAIQDRALVSFHTDVRSEKVAEIEQEPNVSALVGDWSAGIQIRLEGRAQQVIDDDERLAVWNASRPGSLALYRAPLPPGTLVDSPPDARPKPDDTTAHTQTDGFEHFCLIDVIVSKIDFLDVSGEMHRRANFWLERNEWHGHWIAP
ncbi:pyridoxamine 5'-phosphate oxidase family protein [Caballeronia sp. LP006]|uniref:pyridoxamine 5'-phosphate oxidase family protein n=1 Tax=Caballeronia sp. LP006 TaxID=3038552 RepID=UPI00285CBE70|nr:pyridoxamine 5'-phosphate oxidase family protein [Caballeronia sp. LP006]MDR5826651.1 pyridoxamine 5'-phosphate oxidase family protein [Caballeronia sp. LP006]